MTIPIVIVDDEKADRYIVRRIAQDSGIDCRVIEYKAGDEFVDAVIDEKRRAAEIGVSSQPMMVFLDINMPRMSGLEVLESIKKNLYEGVADPECMVVLMFSSSDHAEDKSEAFSYSFVKDYIVKPLTKEKLKDLVAKHYRI